MKLQERSRPARIILLLTLATLIAACGSTASTPASPTGSAGSSVIAASTPTAAATPTGSASPGSSSSGPAATPAALAADWPTFHLDLSRSGYSPEFPALHVPLSSAWSAKLDGAVYAEPIVVHGHVIAATEGDSVYSLDPTTGKVLWARKLGTPVRLSTLPCGNIDPLGITGTPAFDSKTGLLFVVAEVTGPKHVMFALDPDNGTVRWSRGVDLAGDSPSTHQQRTAVAIGNGYAYFGFGGLAGDCGQYVGEIVGVPTGGSGSTIAYRVPVKREGAVWATGNPTIDDAGHLYISTGNGSSTTSYDGSDSVVELSADLKMLSRFAPTSWASDNARDLDLGSLAPTLVPGGFVFIAGKSGIGYVLRQGALGGIGGQLSQATVCDAFGATARRDTTIYVPCRDRLRAVEVTSDGKLHVGWQTTAAGGPPVIGGGAVWSVSSSGLLVAIDPSNGATLAEISVGSVPHFATPALWNGLVLVGTMGGVVAVKA